MAARELGIDRVEIRRQNLIRPDEFPYRTPTGNIYDSGNYQGVLEKVARAGRLRPLGRRAGPRRAPRVATSASASSPRRSAASSARRSSGSGSTSRSSRRPRARRARASRSTRPARSSSRSTRRRCGATAPRPSSRRWWPRSSTSTRRRSSITYADSQHALPGTGPGGSRYTVMVSGAVAGAAAEVKDKIRRIAARQARGVRGRPRVPRRRRRRRRRPDRQPVARRDRADGVHVPARPARRTWRAAWRRSRPTTTRSRRCRTTTAPTSASSIPFVGHAWHIAVVEVDVETGKLEFLRYAAVHDAGTIVNPKTLDGQIIGGTIQGLGTALYEEYLYDDEGRVLNEALRVLPPAVVDGRADDDRRATRRRRRRSRRTASRARARAAGC